MLFSSQTVGEWLLDWLETKRPALRPKTIEQYARLIRLHTSQICNIRITKLRTQDCERLITEIWVNHARTAEQVYILLHTAFADAVRYGKIKVSPMSAVRRPRYHAGDHKVYDTTQQRRLLDAVEGTNLEMPVLLGLLCGLRRGEICGLRWQDVDLSARVLHIRNQQQRIQGQLVDGAPKSAESIRDIPIPAKMLTSMRVQARIGGYVCGYTPDGLEASLRSCCKRNGLPWIGIHGLRHTCATNCIRAGVQMKVLQRLLGHASYVLTASTYSHVDADMIQEAIETSERFVI